MIDWDFVLGCAIWACVTFTSLYWLHEVYLVIFK